MKRSEAIYVASDGDMVGSRILSELRNRGYSNILNDRDGLPDIRNLDNLNEFFQYIRPEYVFLTAGKSGGIQANRELPWDFMLDNLKVTTNVIEVSHRHGVKRLLNIASSCVYPKFAAQPMRPEMLMTGHLEPTNASYATAKLAGIELCRAYRQQYGASFLSVIPANVFGPGDDFDENKSHVVAALIRKVHRSLERKSNAVEIWGSGTPQRELIFIDDLVDACLFVMDGYNGDDPINIGTGQVVSIAELASVVKTVANYDGQLVFDPSCPDGMPSKLLDSGPLLEAGWQPQFELEDAIRLTYDWYLKQFVTPAPPP